jgi:hypothetical protein
LSDRERKEVAVMKAASLTKMKRLEQEAREHILERGKVEFRVDATLMSVLLDLAKQKKVPLGPMIREWVKERAEQEVNPEPSQLDLIEQKIDKLLTGRNRASA